MVHHCSTFSVAFLRDLYGGRWYHLSPNRPCCRQRRTKSRIFIAVCVSLAEFQSGVVVLFVKSDGGGGGGSRCAWMRQAAPCFSVMTLKMVADNNIFHWHLTEVTSASIFHSHRLQSQQLVPANWLKMSSF